MDFLEGLNPAQRKAVAHTEGPLLILAVLILMSATVVAWAMSSARASHRRGAGAALGATAADRSRDEN